MRQPTLLFLGALLIFCSSQSYGQKIYWVEGNQVRSANLDGSGDETVFADATNPPDNIELDINNELIFYQSGGEELYRASLFDGTGKEMVYNYGSMTGFTDFALMAGAEYVFMNYWQEGQRGGIDRVEYYDELSWFSLPLNSPGVILDEEHNAITVDENNEEIYFSIPGAFPGSGLYRTDMSGISWTLIEPGDYGPVMEFDNRREKLYFVNSARTTLYRMDANSLSVENLFTTGFINSLAINELDGSIYWTEGNAIRRANYDGIIQPDILTGLSSPGDIEIYIEPGSILVTNTNDAGPGSLRAAISGAQVLSAITVQIAFDIPDTEPHTIAPTTALPAITRSVAINGYTQEGAAQNSEADFQDATLAIILDGSNLGTGTGLIVAANNTTIRGLSIVNFPAHGIGINGINNCRIEGNFIGVLPDGTTTAPNGSYGIYVDNGTNCVVGGITPDRKNVISANGAGEIIIEGAASTGNTIANNLLGSDNTGFVSLAGDNAVGILLDDAGSNVIGGSTAISRNVIVGHQDGIVIRGANASGNSVLGNSIGTDVYGNSDMQNSSTGIYVHSGAQNSTIGNVTGGANYIVHSDNHGVLVDGASTTGHAIRGNAIFCAGSDNIALTDGGNGNIARPVIGYASTDSVSGTAPANATVDLYLDNSGCGSTGATHYETTVTADGTGFWAVNGSGMFAAGMTLTAVATSGGSSSPFSTPVTVPLEIVVATLATTNQYVDLEFNFPAYNGASGGLTSTDLNVIVDENGGNSLSVNITSIERTGGGALTGGEAIVRVFIDITGYPTGVEELSFHATDDNSIFDESGMALLSAAISPKVTLNPAPVITNASFSFEMCPGETTEIEATADLTGTSFSWTAAASSAQVGGFSASGTTNPIEETLTSLSDSDEQVTYTVTPVFNSIEGQPRDFVVTLLPNPNMNVNPPGDTICSGDTPFIQMTNPGNPTTTYSWTASAAAGITGFADGSGALINQTLENAGANPALVTYTITPTLDGCVGEPSEVEIVVKPVRSVELTTSDFSVCHDVATVDLEISATGPGPWSITLTRGVADFAENDIATSPYTIAGIPIGDGTNTFSIKNATDDHLDNSCLMDISGAQVVVTRIDEVNATLLSESISVCEGVASVNVPISFAGGSGPWELEYEYNGQIENFNSPNATVNIPIAPVAGSNAFRLLYLTDESAPACARAITGETSINQIPAPTATLSTIEGGDAMSACRNEEIQLEVNLTGSGPWEVVLEDGVNQETFLLNDNPSIINTTVRRGRDFTYTLSSVQSTGENCEGTTSGAVNVDITPLPSAPPVDAISGPLVVCQNEQGLEYSVADIPGAEEYQWTFSDGVSLSQGSVANASSVLVDFSTGISMATISVAGVNQCGAGSAASFPVDVNGGALNPGAIAGPDQVCQGAESVQFSISPIDNATGYTWHLSFQGGGDPVRSITASPAFVANFPVDFTAATLTVAGFNQCDTSSQRAEKAIDVLPLPERPQQINGPDGVCEGEEIVVSVQEIESASQYVWLLPEGVSSTSGRDVTNTNTISLSAGSASGVFSINVHGRNACGDGPPANAPLQVSIEPAPQLTITAPESAYLGQRVDLAGSELTGQQVVEWLWDFGDGESSAEQETTHTYFRGGVMTVRLTAVNAAECQGTASQSLEVINELPVTIMNVITPNGDGNNDGLFIDGIELFEENEVIMLNRMGIAVLSLENYRNNWAEVFSGRALKPGNYVVIFKLKGTDLTKKQTVSVLN